MHDDRFQVRASVRQSCHPARDAAEPLSLEVRALLDAVDVAAARGDWGEASALALEGLEQLRAHPEVRAVLCHNLAAILREAVEFEFAAGYQKLAGQFGASNEANASNQPSRLSAEAADRLARGDLDGAELRFAIGLQEERRRGDVAGEAADWGNLFLVAMLRMDWRSALFRWRRAWRLHRRLNDERALGIDLLNLAELALRLRKPRSARRLLDRAAIHLSLADARGLVERAMEKRDECRIPLAQVRLAAAVN